MIRTFHHRISAASMTCLVLLGFLAFYFFWHRASVLHLLVALALTALIVVITERLLHTKYVFDGKKLTVIRGRFARRKDIRVEEIIEARPVKVAFGIVSYVLISYGAHRQLTLQPDNEQAFVAELAHRQQLTEEHDE